MNFFEKFFLLLRNKLHPTRDYICMHRLLAHRLRLFFRVSSIDWSQHIDNRRKDARPHYTYEYETITIDILLKMHSWYSVQKIFSSQCFIAVNKIGYKTAGVWLKRVCWLFYWYKTVSECVKLYRSQAFSSKSPHFITNWYLPKEKNIILKFKCLVFN